jgi:hypothetical protein
MTEGDPRDPPGWLIWPRVHQGAIPTERILADRIPEWQDFLYVEGVRSCRPSDAAGRRLFGCNAAWQPLLSAGETTW